jgi:cysteine desulfurase/selenocysteine lyase
MTLAQFKEQFNKNSEYIHFNNSGQAPIPENYRQKAFEWMNRFYSEGAICASEGWHQTEITRKMISGFINAEPEEVSFFQTTASALSQAAFGISLNEGDEILTWDQEYPSNFYPWRIAAEKSGAKLIQIKSKNHDTPYQIILDQVTSKTKVIAVSWVQFISGAVTDLSALARALKGRNIWIVADVIQGLGIRPFDFKESGLDIICCGSHKWLCSGYGAAFMVTKKERLNEIFPIEFGGMTFGDPDTPKSYTNLMKTNSQKFEPGSKSMIEIIAMQESLQLISAVGLTTLYAEADRLSDLLRDALMKRNFIVRQPQSGPIVSFETGNTIKDQEIYNWLLSQKISVAYRGKGIRVSIHGFNHDHEVYRMIETLDQVKSASHKLFK